MAPFPETFTDRTKKVYYPSTWGGKTAPELFEDLKKQWYYIALSIMMRTLLGFVWVTVMVAYVNFLFEIRRLRNLPEGNRQRLDNQIYLSDRFIYRWVAISIIFTIITGFWIYFEFTRECLYLGGGLWLVFWIAKKPMNYLKNKLLRPGYQLLPDKQE